MRLPLLAALLAAPAAASLFSPAEAPERFWLDGARYSSVAQYVLHEKAWLAERPDVARELKQEHSLWAQKALDKQELPRGDRISSWPDYCPDAVAEGFQAEVAQSRALQWRLRARAFRVPGFRAFQLCPGIGNRAVVRRALHEVRGFLLAIDRGRGQWTVEMPRRYYNNGGLPVLGAGETT